MRRHRFLRPTMLLCVPLVCLFSSVSLAHAAATKPFIADVVIDPDRSRVPEGKLTIGVHVSLSPKWLNPQDTPGAMANELVWKMHDYMIKAAQGNLYSYALAEF